VPLILYKYNLADYFVKRLMLRDLPSKNLLISSNSKESSNLIMQQWTELADTTDHLNKEVLIALVGKYTKNSDTYTSIVNALGYAGVEANRKVIIKYIDSSNLEKTSQDEEPVKYHEAWQVLCKADGILVPGGFGNRGVEGMINAGNWARINKKPYLGICLGFQTAVIEYCRNVLKLTDANSLEFSKETSNAVIIEMPEHNQGQMGGTMRLGVRKTLFTTQDSILRKLYGNVNHVDERHRHRYEVNPKYVADLKSVGMEFTGQSEDGDRMEIMELKGHPYYVGVQYHPEYLARPTHPSAPFVGLILAASGKLDAYMNKTLQKRNNKRLDSMNITYTLPTLSEVLGDKAN